MDTSFRFVLMADCICVLALSLILKLTETVITEFLCVLRTQQGRLKCFIIFSKVTLKMNRTTLNQNFLAKCHVLVSCAVACGQTDSLAILTAIGECRLFALEVRL
jgi:hypothetical protein